jgi:hypothetical protein
MIADLLTDFLLLYCALFWFYRIYSTRKPPKIGAFFSSTAGKL